MNNVKSGISYFRAVKNSIFRSGASLPKFIILLFCVALFFVLNQIRLGEKVEVIMLYNLFIAYLLFSGESLRAAKAKKPNLAGVCPVPYKRKALCDCLSVLFIAVAMFAVTVITVFLIVAIPMVFISCIVVDLGTFLSFLQNLENLLVQVDAQAVIFLALYALLVYGLALVLGTLKKLRWRIVLCAVLVVLTALMMTGFLFAVKDVDLIDLDGSWAHFGKVPLCALWSSLVGVGAVAAIATGAVRTVIQAKPTNI